MARCRHAYRQKEVWPHGMTISSLFSDNPGLLIASSWNAHRAAQHT